LTQLGHEVIVAHARNVRLIGESSRKDDRLDARMLARLARLDPRLLSPVQHRSAEAQVHLTVIRARAALVGARTALVNSARGLAKSYRERLRKCGTQQVSKDLAAGLSAELRAALEPLLAEVASLNQRIAEYDRRIEQIAKQVHPEVALLKQVKGVETRIALQQPTGAPLAQTRFLARHPHGLSLRRWAYHFFDSTTFSASMSSACCATIFFSRPFSSSS
jgi:transposase